MAQTDGSLKSIIYALSANTAITIVKAVAAFITGSGSLFAEAIHSLSDCMNQILLLIGIKRSKLPATEKYPLGRGNSIYFYSFLVALLLFGVGGMFSIYEGWHKIQDPQPINMPYLALGVLIFAFFAEGGAFWGCLREVNKIRGETPIWKWFTETRKSELIVILGEDFAAMIGLLAAIFAVTTTIITGNPFYDALGSIIIGVLLIIVAILLWRETQSLLIGESAENNTKRAMTVFLNDHPLVSRLFNLVTLQIGRDVMVSAKVEMDERESVPTLLSNINTVEAEFKQHFPEVRHLALEPDYQD